MAKADVLKLLGRDAEADASLARANELAAIGKQIKAQNASESARNLTIPAMVDKPASNAANDTAITILGLDSTSFPMIKIMPFVNTSCARTGGLSKEDFRVKENSQDVEISSFYFSGNASGQSLDLAVVFDDSGSMKQQIDATKSKINGLIKHLNVSGLDARYALVTFSDKVTIRANWTKNQNSIYRSINSLRAFGGDDEPEASLDAIEAALSMGFRPNAQKIILVVTDAHAHYRGDGTTYSDYTKEEIEKDLKNSGVIFMPISAKFKTSSKFVDLRGISNETQSTWTDIKSAEFSTLLDRFEQILTGTYVLEYASKDVASNTNRTVTVAIDKTECAVGSASATYTSPEKR